jgi:serine/threonine protein kinase
LICYCINPRCSQRINEDNQETCLACGTLLTVKGRYRLTSPLKPLNKDAPSEVFKIFDLRQPDHPQVIKIVHRTGEVEDAKRIELLQREAGVLINFAHPGIPNAEFDGYFEIQTEAGESLYCLVMDWLEGDNLLDWLEVNGPVSSAQALDWLQQLTHILHVLHSNWVFHRDLKPDNIIIQPSGRLVIVDFGAVREVTNAYMMQMSADPSSLGSEGKALEMTRIYTYGYAGPEQVNGRAIPQSDFFSLGRTLIHLATATHPKYLPVDHQTNKLQWRDQAQQISEELATHIDRLIENDPRKRPQSTDELLGLIEALGGTSARITTGPAWLRPKALIIMAGIAGLFTVGSLGINRIREFQADSSYARGIQALDVGNLAKARTHLEDSLELHPSPPGYLKLAFVCSEMKDRACAINTYQAAIERYPDQWEFAYELGTYYDEIGETKKATQYYTQAISSAPKDAPEAYNNLGRLKILEGNLSAAQKLIQTGLSQVKQPEIQSNLLKNYGWIFLLQGQYLQADKQLTQAISLNQENAAAFCLKAQVLEKIGKDAKANWRQCTALPSELPEVKQWQEEYVRKLQITKP